MRSFCASRWIRDSTGGWLLRIDPSFVLRIGNSRTPISMRCCGVHARSGHAGFGLTEFLPLVGPVVAGSGKGQVYRGQHPEAFMRVVSEDTSGRSESV